MISGSHESASERVSTTTESIKTPLTTTTQLISGAKAHTQRAMFFFADENIFGSRQRMTPRQTMSANLLAASPSSRRPAVEPRRAAKDGGQER